MRGYLLPCVSLRMPVTARPGDHGAAQRAFIQALRLSKAAGDRTHGAHIVANMAVQAIFLNLPAEAVRLARAAAEGAGRNPAPAVTASLSTVEANATRWPGTCMPTGRPTGEPNGRSRS
jgi:hypothetical protein